MPLIFSVLYEGVSMYVGDAVKVYGTHERRKRNIIGVTPWGLIENHSDLMGRDVNLFCIHTLSYVDYMEKACGQYALWNYEAQSADELSFREGDALTVLRRRDDTETEWWWARLNNQEGYVPRNLLGVRGA